MILNQLKLNLESKRFNESITLLLSAIEQYPEEYKLKLNLGNIYKLLGRNNDAVKTYHSLLETPLGAIANNNLALILLEEGSYEKSIHHALEALNVDENYNDAKYNLAIGLFENKKFNEALILCKQLQEDVIYLNKASELKFRIQQSICEWSEYYENKELLKTIISLHTHSCTYLILMMRKAIIIIVCYGIMRIIFMLKKTIIEKT